MIIAIDAMGGDHAPQETVKGAVEALKYVKSDLMLIGDEYKIRKELDNYKVDLSRVIIEATTEVITNDDKPVVAIKRKKDSSMVRGLDLLKKNEIDGFISAGNTGALLAGALLRTGRIRGIDRPAIASVFPMDNKMGILTDAGANADVKSRNLLEFAVMGSYYGEFVLGIESPKVGLANIGAEKGKGTVVVQEAYDLLEKSDLNFIGNVEGRDIPFGVADIVVADGFTGNIILKLTEGVAKTFSNNIKSVFKKNVFSLLAGVMVKKGFDDFKKKMDYTEYGGAPLLGVKGAVIKAHGSSNAKAMMNAVRYTEKYIQSGVIEKIQNYVQDRSGEIE
ncbi:MAG: phosphate acyltransferase PlsX [Clostridiales bacterium]|nr:phosphate acyltransferase PlsX [Clostridiales bacterium]